MQQRCYGDGSGGFTRPPYDPHIGFSLGTTDTLHHGNGASHDENYMATLKNDPASLGMRILIRNS